jgi:hypothetical protein
MFFFCQIWKDSLLFFFYRFLSLLYLNRLVMFYETPSSSNNSFNLFSSVFRSSLSLFFIYFAFFRFYFYKSQFSFDCKNGKLKEMYGYYKRQAEFFSQLSLFLLKQKKKKTKHSGFDNVILKSRNAAQISSPKHSYLVRILFQQLHRLAWPCFFHYTVKEIEGCDLLQLQPNTASCIFQLISIFFIFLNFI